MPGKIKAGVKNHDILGGLDLMATFASVGKVALPKNDREGKPIIFDSYDMSPVLFGTGKCARNEWFYFTEDELSPGAVRVGNYKAVEPAWRRRSSHRRPGGGLQSGLERRTLLCRHRTPGVRPLPGPSRALRHIYEQLHRADLDHCHHRPSFGEKDGTYKQYPPRPLQSATYTGPVQLSDYFKYFDGHTEVVAYLLEDGAKVDATDSVQRTALMFASSGPFPETVKMLLKKGADANHRDSSEGWTALMFSAAEGQEAVCKVLLEGGADSSLKDIDGDMALHHAKTNKHEKVVELLSR